MQRPLFSERSQSNVIPFASLAAPKAAPPPARPASKAHARRPAPPRAPEAQRSLDFLSPAPRAARKLRTTVEAVIYCDAPVATKMHRAVGAALDASMILIAFGLFLLTFHFAGGEFVLNRQSTVLLGGACLIIAALYGFLWALAGCESAGKRWIGLKLINFDGFPPDGAQRLLRFAGACLGFCAAGAGILWAVVDEESLSWHDHISKTFLTVNERDTNFFRQR
ncbi:MAG: RDD family protein [Bryobacteraceae bacterium]